MWMTVLTSEFFWGVIVGVGLTAIGAWWQARLTIRQQKKAQKELIRNFCIDTVENIKAIVDDMVADRQRANVRDYLRLLDIEFKVFGRNREQLIHLPNPVRDEVRRFVNDCGIRRAEIGTYLTEADRLRAHADQAQSLGQGPYAQRVLDQQLPVPLAKAEQALTQLATKVSGSADLVNSLKAVR
jgi:hypothetical protein